MPTRAVALVSDDHHDLPRMAKRGNTMRTRVSIAILTLLALGLAACTADSERIERANEAASGESPVATSETGSASAFDLRTGDCIKNSIGDDSEFEAVETVPCSGPWKYAVLNSFVTNQPDGDFPGMDAFDIEFQTRCDRGSTIFFHPTLESWKIGDRTVNCLIEADAYFVPSIGECYTADLFASSRVDCASPHAFEAYEVATLPDGDYPGDSAIVDTAATICLDPFEGYVGRSYDTSELFVIPIAPTQATWQVVSERTVACYLHLDELATTTGSMRDSGR